MKILPVFSLLLFAGSATAASLDIPQIPLSQTTKVDYSCPDGKHFSVTYFNAGNGQSFALLPYRGQPMLLVNTLSADGVHYQGDSVTWWIKGRGGTLFDTRIDADKPIRSGCSANR